MPATHDRSSSVARPRSKANHWETVDTAGTSADVPGWRDVNPFERSKAGSGLSVLPAASPMRHRERPGDHSGQAVRVLTDLVHQISDLSVK